MFQRREVHGLTAGFAGQEQCLGKAQTLVPHLRPCCQDAEKFPHRHENSHIAWVRNILLQFYLSVFLWSSSKAGFGESGSFWIDLIPVVKSVKSECGKNVQNNIYFITCRHTYFIFIVLRTCISFLCCVVNCHKLGGLKRAPFMVSCFCGWCPAQLGRVLCSGSPGCALIWRPTGEGLPGAPAGPDRSHFLEAVESQAACFSRAGFQPLTFSCFSNGSPEG